MAKAPQNQGRQAADGEGRDRLVASVSAELAQLLAQPLAPALYLVATPIGNLGDISLRALAVITAADQLYCEDTRTSRKLLSRFAVNRQLSVYHEHNGARVRPGIIAALDAGRSVALISDAGTPAISDPGFKLARAAVEAGHEVVAVPGPSAAVTALSASGVATDRFFFAGFLSQKRSARRSEIAELADVPATLVFYESPHRLCATLRDLADVLGNRSGAVARELTKKFEEFRRGGLEDLAAWSAAAPPRGEITIIVGPPAETAPDDITDEDIARHLQRARANASPTRAAREVADALGVPRARVYAVGVAMREDET